MPTATLSYFISGIFLVGLIANLAALCILQKSAKRRNQKHLFMLRFLTTNDSLALIGMIILTNKEFHRYVDPSIYCPGFVVVRAFGLGSGCVAFVMALERWLALTRPFLYQQLVTHNILKKFLVGLWILAVTLTYLPFFGFGVYYDAKTKTCTRFRYGLEPKDRAYAYLFFTFGLKKKVIRRIVNNKVDDTRCQTPEELAFAKLMASVCIIYVACWTPQLMTVPIAQYYRLHTDSDKTLRKFFLIADIALTVHLLLDPFVYVLQGYFEGRLKVKCCNKKSEDDLSTPCISTKTQNCEMSVFVSTDVPDSKPEDH